MTWLWISLTVVAAYLVGSIPFGLLAGLWFKGVDIREHGSRNIGATNAARVLGTRWFFVVLILDALKGAVPCIVAALLSAQAGVDLVIAAAVGALLGHFFSIFLRFKGGKGVATGLGVVLVMTALPAGSIAPGWPLPALCALLVFGAVLLLTKVVSASSIVAALSVPAFYVLWLDEAALEPPLLWRFVFLTAVALFVIVKHRGNIARIMRGKEPRLGERKKAEA
jgi:acyl phosphate:glycerol-3-phosphate acyltransferase